MEKKRGKLFDGHHAGDGTREERLPRKNLEECERSRRTTASTSRAGFCSICSKAEKIATYGGNDVFGRIIPMVVWDQNGYATCVPIDAYVCMCFRTRLLLWSHVWFLRWLKAEYLSGIDCTPVSLRFFQEFEPYDPWHWSLSCSESSSRAAAGFEGRLPRNERGGPMRRRARRQRKRIPSRR